MRTQLLKNLQQKAKKISSNEFKNMTPERLMRLLCIDKKGVKEFTSYLHSEYVLDYKYKFTCSCGCECTAYERKIKKVPFHCPNCEMEISSSEIMRKSWIIYNIDKNEMLKLQNDTEVNLVEGTLKEITTTSKVNNVIELNVRRDKKMKIFIGSSTEAQKDMEDLAVMLEDLDCEVITWKDSGVFIAGDYTLDNLLEISEKVDSAIFVFNGEDETWYRGEKLNSVRDNVLLEYGLFVGKKGRQNVTFMCKNSPKIASDLVGIKYLNGEKPHSLKSDLRSWVDKVKERL